MKKIAIAFCLCFIFAPRTSLHAEETEVQYNTAIFAGGCFWCIEADFEKLKGVKKATSGYTGGAANTARYKLVSKNTTGHIEAVKVYFDANIISYPELVDYFWLHIDPTDDTGQFCDKGDSYRSAIFYSNTEQKAAIERSLQILNKNKPFKGDIVTEVLPAEPFYPAENYHQDYYKKNPLRYK